jgi:hypothetical protein
LAITIQELIALEIAANTPMSTGIGTINPNAIPAIGPLPRTMMISVKTKAINADNGKRMAYPNPKAVSIQLKNDCCAGGSSGCIFELLQVNPTQVALPSAFFSGLARVGGGRGFYGDRQGHCPG